MFSVCLLSLLLVAKDRSDNALLALLSLVTAKATGLFNLNSSLPHPFFLVILVFLCISERFVTFEQTPAACYVLRMTQ